MAVYKVFAKKDSSIYSYYPTKNSGIDEILDLSLYKSIDETGEVSRVLIDFDNNEIENVLSIINNKSYDAYIRLYLAKAYEIPLEYNIYCHPISGSWNMGTGRTSNIPATTNGVSWASRYSLSNGPFYDSSSMVTSSYRSNAGGGVWYSTSSMHFSQSFNNGGNDIEINITNAISSSNYDNGFIIKHSDSLEFNTSSSFELKYFSLETNTIYPPCLEFRWDDSIYNTGSLSLISSSDLLINIDNNKGTYSNDSIVSFRVNVRDRYPTRTFRTSSLYSTNKALPSSSYYAIVDFKTKERVIDFDDNYTKISCDNTGNYFNLHMNGLEPDRYYAIWIKTNINNSTIVKEYDYFKINK